MIMKTFDMGNKFFSVFNSDTGFYVRSGIIENGKDTGIDPFMSSYPQLIDVGIMGSCTHGKNGLCLEAGIECYQNGFYKCEKNMSIELFEKIVVESKGKVFQIALGGRGDPNKHKYFKEICEICRSNNIVPNYTTSGFKLKDEEVEITKEFCGAVAVSYYRSKYTFIAIEKFLNKNMKTNIHYVLGKNTINEAIDKLKNNDFPDGINAIIFLLHKPIGLGKTENVLSIEDSQVNEFFNIIDDGQFNFKIGFDSCTVPGLLNFTENINPVTFDTCEAGRWSMYITPDGIATPCSFDQDKKWGFDIKELSIKNAWNSNLFKNFRSIFRNSCPGCNDRDECMGGCPIIPNIVLCNREEKQ